jgi:hypothetical protein
MTTLLDAYDAGAVHGSGRVGGTGSTAERRHERGVARVHYGASRDFTVHEQRAADGQDDG